MSPPAFRYQLLVSVYLEGRGEHVQTGVRYLGEQTEVQNIVLKSLYFHITCIHTCCSDITSNQYLYSFLIQPAISAVIRI